MDFGISSKEFGEILKEVEVRDMLNENVDWDTLAMKKLRFQDRQPTEP